MCSFYLWTTLKRPERLIDSLARRCQCIFLNSVNKLKYRNYIFKKKIYIFGRDHHFSEIMKSIDNIKQMSGPVYDLGQDSKHSCNEVTKTVDRIKTLAYPGDPTP